MPRIPYADIDALPPEAAEQVRSLPLLNISRMLAHTGAIIGPWTACVRLMLTDSDVPATLRELAILRVAHRLRCAYEREQHVALARKVGLSDAAIEATTEEDPDESAVGSDGRAVVAAVDQLLATGTLDDDAFSALHAVLGDSGTVKMLLCIGSYTAAAFVLNATQVELDETARITD